MRLITLCRRCCIIAPCQIARRGLLSAGPDYQLTREKPPCNHSQERSSMFNVVFIHIYNLHVSVGQFYGLMVGLDTQADNFINIG